MGVSSLQIWQLPHSRVNMEGGDTAGADPRSGKSSLSAFKQSRVVVAGNRCSQCPFVP